ncbi:MAG: hypothetical protein ACLRRT_13095 [Ruthenibacterium lactatiformans]
MYVWSGVWQNAGWNSIIYIAALAAIDPSCMRRHRSTARPPPAYSAHQPAGYPAYGHHHVHPDVGQVMNMGLKKYS